MDFRNGDGAKENAKRPDESKIDVDKAYFRYGNESDESEIKSNIHAQPKDGVVAPKPSDVKNGDLVSLLLAATPPYLYNIPLVPQTFFFSEMLKSFVQAKAERQNFKAQQAQHRRQRKRSWREMTPPKTMTHESREKPLELTTPKQIIDKSKILDKNSIKKYSMDTPEKKYESSGLESSNFTIEKLANSSITSGSESTAGNLSSDLLPPAPPLWYPLLYPPNPPYGIDPLHFFIDLRVSAHFWDKKVAGESCLNKKQYNFQETKGTKNVQSLFRKERHSSAFTVPNTKKEWNFRKNETKKNLQNVHYVVSSLKDIYKVVNEKERKEPRKAEIKGEKEKSQDEKCKELRALIGLELVVDYVKQESDGEEKSDVSNPDQDLNFQTISIE